MSNAFLLSCNEIFFISSIRATKRLMLTGTPIQNDLEELYSIVSFALPGYLGV